MCLVGLWSWCCSWLSSLKITCGVTGWFSLLPYTYCLNYIRFISKLCSSPNSNFVAASPKSVERSLLLFIFNVAELLIAFAIFYRGWFGLRVLEAIKNAILVFGTIGFRKDEIVDTSSIVSVQIVLDFLLLAVFLATLIGRVGPFGNRER